MARLLYKPIGLVFSVLGGLAAGAIFKRLWRLAANEDEAPKATDQRRGWAEITAAAAAHGAVYGGVKALIDRLRQGQYPDLDFGQASLAQISQATGRNFNIG